MHLWKHFALTCALALLTAGSVGANTAPAFGRSADSPFHDGIVAGPTAISFLFDRLWMPEMPAETTATLTVTSNGQPLDTTSVPFYKATTCINDQSIVIPIDFSASGQMPLVITSIEVYQTDTVVMQGAPRYPLSRTWQDRLIPINDYALVESSAGGTQSIGTPYMLMSSPTQLYLAFNPQRLGARFGRVIIRTNASNLYGSDTNGVPTMGILTFDVFGRGQGARLSSTLLGNRVNALNMGTTHIGTTSTRWVRIVNSGTCSLYIERASFKIASGDADQFRIDSLSPGFDATIDERFYTLRPGAVDSMRISFSPNQIGSRRATIYVRTNDSMIGGEAEGIDRGVLLLDLNGNGADGLYASLQAAGADLGVGVIGDSVGPFARGFVRVTNNGNVAATIDSFAIADGDLGEFRFADSASWPAVPLVLQPGMWIDLPVEFHPNVGNPGIRTSALRVYSTDAGNVDAPITGLAGTRSLTATPLTIAYPTVRTGRLVRRTVVITNTGTLPLSLQQPTITGTDPDRFAVSSLPRLQLDPSQSELLEVTFKPNVDGPAAATVIIINNAGDPIEIQLTGTATFNRYSDDDPDAATIGDGGFDRPDESSTQFGIATAGNAAAALRLEAIRPNPAVTEATVHFAHAAGTTASLLLVDARGVVVWSQTSAASSVAERSLQVPVASLAAGSYVLRLSVGAATLVQTLVVAH